MEDNGKLAQLLLLWLGAAIVVSIEHWKRKTPGVGLIPAYLFNFWLNYWIGPALYALPWYRQRFDFRLVELGFEQSVWAVLAFALGSLVVAPFLVRVGLVPAAPGKHKLDRNLPRAYIGIGILCYVAMYAVQGVATVTALISSGQQLAVIGLSLSCWQSWQEKDFKKLSMWLGITALLPFITTITRGFLGAGAVATFIVFVFVSNLVRSRVKLVVVGVVLGYLGMSVFVTYMRDRDEIRKTVWGGQSLQDRVGSVTTALDTFEWLDPWNEDHLERIDARLNQSFLVGAAVRRLSDYGGYAYGATLWQALQALIPRVFWPDKPTAAGSGNLVSEFTGIQFSEGTSVGIGQVMEFYVNFGTVGVVIGFIIVGALITILDGAASERLAAHNLPGFVLWYLPGLSLLQVGGSMVEITSSIATCVVVAMVVNRYLERIQRKQAGSFAPAVSPSILGRNA